MSDYGVTKESKALAGAAHFGVIFNILGIAIALVIFITQREKSKFIAENAKQALGYQIVVAVIAMIFTMFLVGMFAGSAFIGEFITGNFPFGWHSFPFFGAAGIPFLFVVFNVAVKGYGIYAAIRALMGEDFRYIIIGDYVARL